MTKTVMLILVRYGRILGTLSEEMYYNTMQLQVVTQIRFPS